MTSLVGSKTIHPARNSALSLDLPDLIRSGLVSRIDTLFKRLEELSPDHKEYQPTRKQLFQQTSLLYRQFHSSMPAGMDNEEFLTRAEEVRKGAFSSHPGAEGRLTPLAERYLQCFSQFKECIQSGGDSVDFVLNEVASSHKHFAEQHWEEIKQIRKNDGPVLATTHQEEIRLAVAAYLNTVARLPYSTFQTLAQRLEESDPEVIFLLPSLMVLFTLRTEGHLALYQTRSHPLNFDGQILRSTQGAPKDASSLGKRGVAEIAANLEGLQDRAMRWDAKDAEQNSKDAAESGITLLTPYSTQIEALREQVDNLSLDESERIDRALLGENVDLAAETRNILKTIQEIGTYCQRGDQAQFAAGFLDALFSSLRQIHELTTFAVDSLNANKDLVYTAFFERPAYEQFLFLRLISDKELAIPFIQLKGLQYTKKAFTELSQEEQNKFIQDYFKGHEFIDPPRLKKIDGDISCFSGRILLKDQGNTIPSVMRLAEQFYSKTTES